MNVTYTGRHIALTAAQTEKLHAEFGASFNNVSKLLDSPKGEASAHVRVSQERYLHHVEITVGYHGHDLIGEASGSDLFTAVHEAVARLEKQAIRTKDKWRESKREPLKDTDGSAGPDVGTGLGEIKKRAS